MHLSFCYFFENRKLLPSFVYRNISFSSAKGVLIQLSPLKDLRFPLWRSNTLDFWKFLTSLPPKTISYDATTTFTGKLVKISALKASESLLFSLNTSNYFLGFEEEMSLFNGCSICGSGKKKLVNPMIDERNISSYNVGFSSAGRFVVHVNVYEKMLQHKLTGFIGKPVECMQPDRYVVKIWPKENAMMFMETFENEYGGLSSMLKYEEWGESLFFFVEPCFITTKEFMKFDAFFSSDICQDSYRPVSYQLIPLAKEILGFGKCRWVEIQVTGDAGREEGVNEYNAEAKCPICNYGGWCPKENLVLDYTKWDKTDICMTEKGRICISAKASIILNLSSIQLVSNSL